MEIPVKTQNIVGWCLALVPTMSKRGELGALDVLHDQVIRADIVQDTDVGMIPCGDGFGFPLETFGEVFLRNLDRDVTTDTGIARLPHLSHATFSDWRDAFICAEFVAGGERHVLDLG